MNKTAVPKRPVNSVLTTKNGGETWINAVYCRQPGLFEVMTHEEESRLFKKINKAVRRVLCVGPRTKIKWDRARTQTLAILQAMRKSERRLVHEAVLRNIRLVLAIARKFHHPSFSLEDLVNYGLEGLLTAILRFDLSRGFKFSTYAVFWIRHAVQRSVCDFGGIVRLPVHTYDYIARVRRCAKDLIQSLGRNPTEEELSKASGLPLHKIRQYFLLSTRMFSLNMTGEQLGGNHQVGEKFEFQDLYANTETLQIHPFDDVETSMDMERIGRIMLRRLRPKERMVLELRFLEGLTLEQVAKDPRIGPYFGNHFPVSRERVRQLQYEALQKIRAGLRGRDRSLVLSGE